MRPESWFLRALLGVLTAAVPAAALDSFHATRSELLAERKHSAVLTLEPDHAELVVSRTFFNGAKVSDQATLYIDLPEGAVATRLRTRGIGPNAPWFEGELLEAEEAARRYQELTGLGGYYPKDPALLSWCGQRELALQVFPCPPRAEKVVEYTLQLPTRYEHGTFRVSLPTLGTERLEASIQLVAKDPRHRLTVDGKPFASGGTLPRGQSRDLELGLATAVPAFQAELVSVPLSHGRALTRYALRAAPRLSSLPRRAHVVLVIDASRSVGDAFEAPARAALDAYLSHLPDAQVEILTFDRHVRRELGAFRTSAEARTALQGLTLQRRNGSDLDRALFEADQLLLLAPSGVPRRIVVLSDGAGRQGLTPERLRGAVGRSGALVHLGLLSSGVADLSRDDEHPWAIAPRATGGVLWRASAPASASLGAEQRRDLTSTYEEWARPLSIDRISGFSDNEALTNAGPSQLREGAGAADLQILGATAKNVSFSGELWSQAIRADAQADETQQRLWAALVFGSPTLWDLSEPEMMTLALKGGAVSPVTSYLAIEPGVRPSTEGLDDSERTHNVRAPKVRMGAGCTLGGRAQAIDLQDYLERALRPELVRCGGAGSSARLELETTFDEIVAVTASVEPSDPMVEGCLSESTWALLLPKAFYEEWASFVVEL